LLALAVASTLGVLLATATLRVVGFDDAGIALALGLGAAALVPILARLLTPR
jgi:hypothetical protein